MSDSVTNTAEKENIGITILIYLSLIVIIPVYCIGWVATKIARWNQPKSL